MAHRAKPYGLVYPFTVEGVKNLDKMLQDLYQDKTTVQKVTDGLPTFVQPFIVGDILVAGTTIKVVGLSDVAIGSALISGGIGLSPRYGKIGLTTHVSGVLPEINGGTNHATYTTGDLLYASAANTLSILAAANPVGAYLRSGGVGAAPSWSLIGLPNAATAGNIVIVDGSGAISATGLAPVAANRLVRSNGLAVPPVYTTFTIPDTFAKGDIPTATAANVLGVIAPGTAAYVLTSNGAGLAASFQALPASGGSTWSVLTNGDVANPELIFANGDVIMIQV